MTLIANDAQHQNPMALLTAAQLESTEPLQDLLETASLYLHIPFCHTRCFYCDFNTYAGILPLREPYIHALETEIQLSGTMARKKDGTLRRARTIFFGGGTPSLLSPEQIIRLLNACKTSFNVDEQAEITMEANPGTLTGEQLKDVHQAGINRLSMGAQSFDANLLKALGRIHTPEEIVQAIHHAREAGFNSVNIDLMFGLPEQTMQQWRETLDQALEQNLEHFSLYNLIIEEGTPFFDWANTGKITPGDEDLCADMYEYADELLTKAGYVNYEISNWARPGYQSQHNLTYWRNLPYIGMGAGAYSSFKNRRFSNEKNPGTYIKRLKQLEIPEVESEAIGHEQEMSETSFLALRTAAGLHLPTFTERFHTPFATFVGTRLHDVEQAGLLEYDGPWLRLSPRGRLLGNEVFMRLLPDE